MSPHGDRFILHEFKLDERVGFSGSSAGKGSACSAEEPGLILGSGKSPGDGIGCSLKYSWASMVAQMASCNTGGLGWEEPLEEGMALHSGTFAWRVPWTEAPGGLQSMELQSWT